VPGVGGRRRDVADASGGGSKELWRWIEQLVEFRGVSAGG
jgi:hypothetical protein